MFRGGIKNNNGNDVTAETVQVRKGRRLYYVLKNNSQDKNNSLNDTRYQSSPKEFRKMDALF